jgi:glycosyltransferase involved in cell wall biosynthesis
MTTLRNIGFVSPGWPPEQRANGIITYVGNARRGLSAAGVASCVLTGNVDSTDGTDDIVSLAPFRPPGLLLRASKAYERVTKTKSSAWEIGYAVARALRQRQAVAPLDLVEMEESFGSAWYAQGAISAPLVIRLHGPWCVVAPALGLPEDAVYRRRVTIEGLAIRDADGLSSPCRFALDRVASHYGIDLRHAEVVPNPVELEPPDRRWQLAQSDRKTILFVGRFDRLKGADLVLSAFRDVARKFEQAELVVVGPDNGLNDGARVWKFDEYVRHHVPAELLPRIKMLGKIPASSVAALRRTAFVTVVASRYETFPMVVLEAMALGSPLIGAEAGGVAEILVHEKNGLSFRSEDAEGLARNLLLLFENPELASRLGAAAYDDVAARFTPNVIAERMLGFYERVVARSAGRRRRFARAFDPTLALFPGRELPWTRRATS